MVLVADLKKDLELPEEFLNLLPEECPVCGSSMFISETLTGLHCADPRCTSKVVQRILAICTELDIKGLGEKTAEKFLAEAETVNPLSIFYIPKSSGDPDTISVEVYNSLKKQIAKVLEREFALWEFVKIANIPHVQNSARKLLSGYSDLEEFFDHLEEGGVNFVQERLGVQFKEDEYALSAIKVYNSLVEFEDELLEVVGLFKIKNLEGVRELNVVCSDQVGGGFKTKNEFYNAVREEFSGEFQVNFLSSVSQKINALIWAGADGSPARYTSKVQKVEGYQAKGNNIPIYTAAQFIDYLRDQS